MYLRPALKFVELIASISTEDEMINCASTPAPWEVPFKLRVDCNTANTLGAGGSQEARGPPRVHNNGFYYPPTLVDIF